METVLTDTHGHFEMSGAFAAVDYFLHVREEDSAMKFWFAGVCRPGEPARIVVPADRIASGVLAGTVLDPRGKPVPSSRLVLNHLGENARGRVRARCRGWHRQDGEGAAWKVSRVHERRLDRGLGRGGSARRKPPGRYTVEVRIPGGRSAGGEFVVDERPVSEDVIVLPSPW